MSQPQLIDQILKDLGYMSLPSQTRRYMTKSVDTPAASTITLTRDLEGPVHNEKWDYQSVIGNLSFLEKSTQLNLMYSVHNVAQFSANLKATHSQAIKRIGCYLLGS